MAFSVVGDIAKAHRRFKHAAKEHGYLACQVDAEEETPGDPASQTVYVNLVGTFGLSCASYWWTRVAACGLRLTYHLLGPGFPLDMLLYADDLESMGRGAKGRRIRSGPEMRGGKCAGGNRLYLVAFTTTTTTTTTSRLLHCHICLHHRWCHQGRFTELAAGASWASCGVVSALIAGVGGPLLRWLSCLKYMDCMVRTPG